MSRVCFHSDDSFAGNGAGRFSFVTAGIALDGIKSEARNALIAVETRSRKEALDWHSTKDVAIRVAYIEALLKTSVLVGRVFYGAFPSLAPTEYWSARRDVLGAAIDRYTTRGRCFHEMYPEGLKLRPRQILQGELKISGRKRVTVEAGNIVEDPEMRCADALAGYIRSKLFDTSVSSRALSDLPEWLVNLCAVQNEALRG